MKIKINNQEKEIAEHTTLQNIVFGHLGDKQNGTAVAVNNSVIQKSLYESYQLKANDDILIIKATQGG
ncbi:MULTISPECIES: sulfur carrier protein ThiS [unclassified Pedobacter]|jgi:sulfur carrier protein|uniref:sulfur carrier protein ThiS n=1 Tax=unclassified Pedobacter TaxID=2628915 RepID=UPI000D3AE8CF|nr:MULTISPECIES: sulfur carrier protein ThiS [unclassified Pedobacter]PTT00169.1 thiamine biosynthesis protein ThiS [Pedobacter sp. HMWF019]HWW38579.1 sulfur carrier protein ThiS [Pedobacter sp.]